MGLFHGFFTAPSWQSFKLLACGWALATDRHITFDDTTKKKAGQHLEGRARYRNGAGSARQAYRTLRGLNFVLGIMRRPLKHWPGHSLSVPMGLELSLPPAHALHGPSRSRSQLARAILDFVAEPLPGRPIRALADGGYVTKDDGRSLPASIHVVGRVPISAKLYELPPTPTQKRRGARRKKGDLIGSPKTLAKTVMGWAPHPSEAGAEGQAWCGLWHSVLPGQLIQVVVGRRDAPRCLNTPGRRKPLPAVEAFFTTALTLNIDAILREYRDRWAVEIAIRDANAFDGLGQEPCRPWHRIVGATTLRLVMPAARTRGFIAHVERSSGVPLCRYRPWDRQKVAPRQLDVVWACREALYEAGIFPIPRCIPVLTR
jgi:hypothetical protein